MLLVLLLLAFVLFLAFPTENLSLPAWIPALQARLWTGLIQAGPYLLVALLGAIVGLAEISSTFLNYPREALRTRWGRILILVNALAAGFALFLARMYAPATNLILLIVLVGFGFQALIRTRFTLAKQIGGPGGNDISVNLGWLYEQFQHLCKTQIDLELMNSRHTVVTQLLECFPTVLELAEVAEYTILARATLSPEEKKVRLDQLNGLFDLQTGGNLVKAGIALLILENGGQAYVELLLSQPPSPAPEPAKPEAVVKRLVEKYSLQELVDRATGLLTAPEERNWVQQAAQPAPGAGQASQKAAIAHYLVDRVGLERISKEL